MISLGRDVIGLAETGSGKTGAFTLPMLNTLLENPQRLFCLILTPTRELAFQISEQIEALGKCLEDMVIPQQPYNCGLFLRIWHWSEKHSYCRRH